MLKLRKPFFQNIQLHIGQELLQKLWDKYVQSSAPEYEKIQLVYLNRETGQEEEQARQIQIFVSFLLKNKMLQMGTEKYPSSLAFGIRRMETSLRRVEKYCLTQLKGRNYTMFRNMNRYMKLLEQEKKERRRYEGWQKEHQEIEKRWEEYRLLSLFSVQVREFLEKYSSPTAGMTERELLASLSETEYHKLVETSVWEKREELIAYLKTCDEVQCQRMVERLKEETTLCRNLLRKAGLPEAGRKEKSLSEERESQERTARERFTKLKFAGKKYAKLKGGRSEVPEKPEQEESALWKILKTVEGKLAGEKLSDMAKLFERREFLLFYQQVVEPEQEDSTITVWKKSREEMLSYLESITSRMMKGGDSVTPDIPEAGFLQQVREQLDIFFPEQRLQLEQKQMLEWNRNFREQISSMIKEEPFTVLADVAENWEEPSQMVQKLEQTVQLWKEQLRQREEQVFEKYREQYQEVLQKEFLQRRILQNNVTKKEIPEKETGEISHQDHTEHFMEMVFQTWYRERAGQEDMTEDEIQNICRWSRMLLETSGYMDSIGEPEYTEELECLMEQVSCRMDSWEIYGETELLLRSGRQLKEAEREETGRMLDYIRELEGERREEFVSRLADAVLLWHQTNIVREIIEEQQGRIVEKQKTNSLAERQDQEKKTEGMSEFPFHDLQFLQSEETGEAGVPYRELWEWGESLLFHPEQGQEWENGDILSGQWQNERFPSQNESQEDLQIQLIRHQIEGAKDKNSLQQLMVQMNHQTEDRFHLVYADSQLDMVPIQNLLRHIRTLDEKQYGILVKELSRITEIQWAMYGEQTGEQTVLSMEKYDPEISLEHKQEAAPYKMSVPFEGKSEEKQSLPEKAQNLPDLEKTKTVRYSGSDAYPGLIFYIQGYERQRRLRMQEYTNNILFLDERGEEHLLLNNSSAGIHNRSEGMEDERGEEHLFLNNSSVSIHNRSEGIEQVSEPVPEHEPVIQNRNFWGYGRELDSQFMTKLTYSTEKNHISDQEQRWAKTRMQQETMQIKSAQAQLDQKLKEVEAELKKVENAAQAKEDVRAFAEQVKKHLYEELHVEKLRRGLV